MLYKTIFRKRALKEYFEAIAWYEKRSIQATENFISSVRQTLDEIEGKPHHFRLTYKNYHEAKIKNYPFNVIYFIDEKEKHVVITTIFHHIKEILERNSGNKIKFYSTNQFLHYCYFV